MLDIHKPQDINQSDRQASSGAAMAETYAFDDIERESAEAVRQHSRMAGEALRQGVDAALEVTRQGTKAGIESARRTGEAANEAMRRTTQMVTDGQRQIVQEAAQTLQEASRSATHSTSEEMRRLATLSQVAEDGLHDLQQRMAALVEGAMQANLRSAQELFRLFSPMPVVALQQRLAGEYRDIVMQGTATLVRIVRRTADETLRPLEAQIEQRQSAYQSYRTAAE